MTEQDAIKGFETEVRSMVGNPARHKVDVERQQRKIERNKLAIAALREKAAIHRGADGVL